MEKTTVRDLKIITIVFICASAVLYGYFAWFTKGGMQTVYRNWDGPAYVVVAKSLYNPEIIKNINTLQPLIMTASYFTQQYPLYPIVIRLFSFMGYYPSMLFVSLLFSLFFLYACYFLVKQIYPKANALVIGLLFIFYLPRWFIVSHVGSSEPMFLFFLTLFWLFFLRKNIFLSAICISLALLTRVAGLFFFAGIVAYGTLQPVRFKRLWQYFMVPVAFFAVCAWYFMSFGDGFIALKEYSLHPIFQWPPFANFMSLDYYYEVWKEGLLFIYILYGVALAVLVERKQHFLAITALPYYLYLFFAHHPDISRYMLPLLPLLAVAYEPIWSRKSVYIPLFFFVPIIYLFAISYMGFNVAGSL